MKELSKRFLTVLFFFSLALASLAQDCAVYHEVAAGETLYGISPVSYTHLRGPRDYAASRMPSSA